MGTINKPAVFFYVTFFLFVLIVFAIDWCRDTGGIEKATFQERKIFAVVHDKYTGDHNLKIMVIHNLDPDFHWSFKFDTDKSGFYNFIQAGDTIRKDSNSLSIEIIRNPVMDTTWNLKY